MSVSYIIVPLESSWEKLTHIGTIKIDAENQIILYQHAEFPKLILAAFDYEVGCGRMMFSLFCEVGQMYQATFSPFLGPVVSVDLLEVDESPYLIHKVNLNPGDSLPTEFDYATLTWIQPEGY